MNAHSFIDLAGRLVANPNCGDSASRHRTAISRAYYGVFHSAVELLGAFDVRVPKNHEGHQTAYTKLFQSRIPRAQEAARLLNDLRGERIRADYRLDAAAPESSGNAKQCVESAHDFCACAADCLNEPLRSQLSAALSS